jgi:hypothetical protein
VPGLRPRGGKSRARRRLSRTLSASRWREYRWLLTLAVGQGYEVLGVEDWLAREGVAGARPVLLLRHDVDQHPRSVLRMAAIEADVGVSSSWYFRWRTANLDVVTGLRARGHSVGLHYETLTRLALARGLTGPATEPLVPEARELLAREIAAFSAQFGPSVSVCPHGDTRVPGVHNGVLLRGQDLGRFGLRWDVNDAVGRYGLDLWLTDRSAAEGRWADGQEGVDQLLDRRSPLLLVVHPNNWVSGPGLWWDRLLPGAMRTGTDEPQFCGQAAAVGS